MKDLSFKIANTKAEYKICYDIRKKVFAKEQKVPSDIVSGGLEPNSILFIVYLNEIPVGTACLTKLKDKSAKISFVAVLKEYRGQNIGDFLITKIIDYCNENSFTSLILAAQTQVIKFYEKFGFEVYGNRFYFPGVDIPHQMMQLDLTAK